jgi:hypothetical protein
MKNAVFWGVGLETDGKTSSRARVSAAASISLNKLLKWDYENQKQLQLYVPCVSSVRVLWHVDLLLLGNDRETNN